MGISTHKIRDNLNMVSSLTFLAGTVPCGTLDNGFIAKIVIWIFHLFTIAGAPAVGFGELVENVFPLSSSEVILPMAGYASRSGGLSYITSIIWAMIGSMLGVWFIYLICRAIGADRLLEMRKYMPGLKTRRMEQSLARFTRHHTILLIFGRLIPVIRSLVIIPAGFSKVNFLKLTLITLGDALIWDSVLIGFGRWAGASWCLVLHMVVTAEIIVFFLCVFFLIIALIKLLCAFFKTK